MAIGSKGGSSLDTILTDGESAREVAALVRRVLVARRARRVTMMP